MSQLLSLEYQCVFINKRKTFQNKNKFLCRVIGYTSSDDDDNDNNNDINNNKTTTTTKTTTKTTTILYNYGNNIASICFIIYIVIYSMGVLSHSGSWYPHTV